MEKNKTRMKKYTYIFLYTIFKLQLQNVYAVNSKFTSSAVDLVILKTSIRDSSSTKDPSVLVRRQSKLSSSSCIFLLLDVTCSISLILSASSSCIQEVCHTIYLMSVKIAYKDTENVISCMSEQGLCCLFHKILKYYKIFLC